jgi:hypothetical protein
LYPLLPRQPPLNPWTLGARQPSLRIDIDPATAGIETGHPQVGRIKNREKVHEDQLATFFVVSLMTSVREKISN